MKYKATSDYTVVSDGIEDIYVYDIEVEDNHNFFGNNILVHNSVYIDLAALHDVDSTQEEVTVTANAIGEGVNDSFPAFMKEAFNVPDRCLDIMQTEREVVSDKSFFMGKKMYQMHVVDDEGVLVDKMKVAGLATKRSDTAKVIQDLLSDLIERMMDGESFKEILEVIQAFKDNYENLSPIEIGRPTGIKKLNEESTAGHIVASRFYNSLCGVNDQKIRAGDKIRVIYIDDTRAKSIAIPVDLKVLPEFMQDMQIHWKRQWTAVEEKLESFLAPVGYDVKSRQAELTSQFVTF